MRKAITWTWMLTVASVILAACAAPAGTTPEATPTPSRPALLEHLHWLGNSTFRLDGPPIIYFDPVALPDGQPQADIILVTHTHPDHWSPRDIKAISGPNTVVIAPFEDDVVTKVLKAGERTTVGTVEIEAVPAYDTRTHRGHPVEAGWVGFIVTVNGERLYHAGDTAFIPEMANIDCDVALLPVFNVDEVVQEAVTIQPRIVIPMHLGTSASAAQAVADYIRQHCDIEAITLELETK